jgi:hypothetical protein
MFEDLIDENDLEFTEHRLRVHVMSLKKREDVEGLFRLYGVLARVLAQRGNHLKAQDALNDAEFLLVEHKWRGTSKEIWCHYDRAVVFQEFGRPDIAARTLTRAEELLTPDTEEELRTAVLELKAQAESALAADSGT